MGFSLKPITTMTKQKETTTIEQNEEMEVLKTTKENVEKARKKTRLHSSMEFWNWEDYPEFEGKYVSEWQSDNGEAEGYVFEGIDGNHHIIGKNHAITKVLNSDFQGKPLKDHVGLLIYIDFLGKTTLDNGRTFNKFDIGILE